MRVSLTLFRYLKRNESETSTITTFVAHDSRTMAQGLFNTTTRMPIGTLTSRFDQTVIMLKLDDGLSHRDNSYLTEMGEQCIRINLCI